ncbi:hypothetical protein D1BOALGB6SA_5864 [Olavius sp. associated proteobacterium Delta 1]|nr:hypothetical protein D1BOALGB6SA_5864 [Olavius sp. associated proteobacterium Delta 1]
MTAEPVICIAIFCAFTLNFLPYILFIDSLSISPFRLPDSYLQLPITPFRLPHL